MYSEPAAHEEMRISLLQWFVMNSSGPLVLTLLTLGAIFTIWGLMNVIFVRNPVLLTLQALLSFVPGLISVVGALYAYAAFAELATSAAPEQPAVYAGVVSTGIVCGVWGPIVTFVSGTLGVLALAKVAFRASSSASRDVPAAKPLPA